MCTFGYGYVRLYIILSLLIIIYTASVAAVYNIKNDGHCYFTVKCDSLEAITTVPQCGQVEPFITLIIHNSPVQNLTADFFNTKFILYVKIFTAVRNNWSVLPDFAFSNIKNLLYIDVSGNNIKDLNKAFAGLKQLDSLNLSHNFIDVVKPSVFKFSEGANRLALLDLSYNLLTYLPEDFLINADYMRRLYLQGNKLTILGGQYGWNLKNLDYLNLCCNQMDIFNMSLENLTSLKELNLSNNSLKIVKLSKTKSLKELYLDHNSIEEFLFDSIPNINVLDLRYNKLVKISSTNIKDRLLRNNEINKPCSIYLQNNNIKYVDKYFFLTFNRILYLNLSYNKITEFKPDTFKYADFIRVLSVSNCGLKLNKDTFNYLNNTYKIDIKSNNISELDAELFKKCLGLRRIEADFNNIKKIKMERYIELVPSLYTISLKGNPIYDEKPIDTITPRMVSRKKRKIEDEVKMTEVILLPFILVGILLILLYIRHHRRVFFVYILTCGRCLLLQKRLCK